MAHSYRTGSGSKMAIAGHPIHPMLIPLPIGLLVSALVADIVFAVTQNVFWAQGAFWLIVGGVVTGLLAGLTGLVELLGVERARSLRAAWMHGLGNIVAVVLALVNLVIRLDDVAEPVVPTGLVLSLLIVLIMSITGWLGGELSYRHGIGVAKNIGSPLHQQKPAKSAKT